MDQTDKSPRPYDATRRQETAAQTRDAILDVAERRFLAEGFAATTIATIAAEAGVSQASIYKSFGGKPGLVHALTDRGSRVTDRPPPSNARIGCRPMSPTRSS